MSHRKIRGVSDDHGRFGRRPVRQLGDPDDSQVFLSNSHARFEPSTCTLRAPCRAYLPLACDVEVPRERRLSVYLLGNQQPLCLDGNYVGASWLVTQRLVPPSAPSRQLSHPSSFVLPAHDYITECLDNR